MGTLYHIQIHRHPLPHLVPQLQLGPEPLEKGLLPLPPRRRLRHRLCPPHLLRGQSGGEGGGRGGPGRGER